MRYNKDAIYEYKCIKCHVKFSILQYKACQIDTKCPKNCKKVWIGEFQTQNSINQDTKAPATALKYPKQYQPRYQGPATTSNYPI